MPENNDIWDLYWESRLLALENLGKRAAILSASGLIQFLAQQVDHPLRLLELGCGEGQVIGSLLEAHFQLCATQTSVGVDYNPLSLAHARRDFAGIRFVEGDFTDLDLLSGLGKFDVVLLVNAMHEVFSDCYSPDQGQIDFPTAKLKVAQALAGAAACLIPGGCLVLFDGLEPAGDPKQILRIRFRDNQIRQEFEKFVEQYHPMRISYREVEGRLWVELSRRDFTRYITKSIFLGKRLWETERLQSYQYYTEAEFRATFARLGLEIFEFRTLTMNDEKWHYRIEIETPGITFPDEHVLILARQVPATHSFVP